jgi:hypothetical protein
MGPLSTTPGWLCVAYRNLGIVGMRLQTALLGGTVGKSLWVIMEHKGNAFGHMMVIKGCREYLAFE